MSGPIANRDVAASKRPRQPVPGRPPIILALVSAALLTVFPQAWAQSASTEYQLKAALLRRFAQFVDWPPEAAARPTVDICVTGGNPFGSALELMVADETLGGRAFQVRDDAEAASCHVLFVASGPPARQSVLGQVANEPVLTVSDVGGFLQDGGIIELRMVGGRARFAINTAAAQRAGLTLSAQLLRLATEIREDVP